MLKLVHTLPWKKLFHHLNIYPQDYFTQLSPSHTNECVLYQSEKNIWKHSHSKSLCENKKIRNGCLLHHFWQQHTVSMCLSTLQHLRPCNNSNVLRPAQKATVQTDCHKKELCKQTTTSFPFHVVLKNGYAMVCPYNWLGHPLELWVRITNDPITKIQNKVLWCCIETLYWETILGTSVPFYSRLFLHPCYSLEMACLLCCDSAVCSI